MKILIVGLGSIARKHIESLQLLNIGVKIYALRSNLNSHIEDGIENIYNLDEFDISVDFAIISNPSNLHYKFIEILAKKGVPLFIEKPCLNSLENSDKLITIINKKKTLTYVACNLRFHPCILFLKKKIEQENLRINELNVYCGSYLPDWRPGQDFRAVYSSNAAMGGGVHLDLIHEIDYITWLFGFPEKSTSFLRKNSSLQIDAIDYANYILEYKSFTASIILNYYRRKAKREIEIVLKDETFTVDLIKNKIQNDVGKCLFEAKNFNIKDSYSLQLEYFINCLKANTTPMNSFEESLQNLKICLNNG